MSPIPEDPVKALLCDADGCLFPSEEPAFEASAVVTNQFLAEIGGSRRFSGEELRLATTGKNFRVTAVALASAEDKVVPPEALERWVEAERETVTAHLSRVLRPDRLVSEPLRRLAARHTLAVVSSSAGARVSACLQAAGLDGLFSPPLRFSAENSLPVPTSKPDPAIYLHALVEIGVEASQALAVEDSVPGALAAVAAGCRTIGNVMFVPSAERARRVDELERAGVSDVVSSWEELELLLESTEPVREAIAG
jgi:beta-phosphoglucomutase-like phosphatase (HAD superfamily)